MNDTTWTENMKKSKNGSAFPALASDMEADAVIVGGGMAGLLSAYLLVKEGKKVVVLEKDRIAQGVTSLTTAFLTASIDTDFADLIRDFGQKKAKMIIGSHQDAVELFAEIVKENGIDCDFMRCSNFIYANRRKDAEALRQEFEAMKKLGLKGALIAPGAKESASLGFPNFGFIEVKHQAKFHPLKFLHALARVITEKGGMIFEKTAVKEVKPSPDSAKRYVAATARYRVQAKAVLVATHEPFNRPLSLYFKKGTYSSYIFEAEVSGHDLREGTYEDTENPYHYLRVDRIAGSSAKRTFRVIAGGEDHRSDIHVDPVRNFNALRKYLDSLFGARNYTVRKKWRGPILEPIDGIASIGPAKSGEDIMYAFGFSGNGMTYSGITAMLFRDMATGRHGPFREIYSADRWPGLRALMTKGRDYSEELLKGAVKNVLTESRKPKKE